MLSARQVAEYADVIFRWIARKSGRFPASITDKARVLAKTRWLCIPSPDYDYYAKVWDSEEHRLYVNSCRLERILLYRAPGQCVFAELEGIIRDTESHSIRFEIKTRLEVATQLVTHLFPGIDPAYVYQDACDPPQTFESIQDRIRYAEATLQAVLARDKAYAFKGAGMVFCDRRLERRIFFRSRGAWHLRLSVELMDDDAYECAHDVGPKNRLVCTQAELFEALTALISNGFALAIRDGKSWHDDPANRMARFLGRCTTKHCI